MNESRSVPQGTEVGSVFEARPAARNLARRPVGVLSAAAAATVIAVLVVLFQLDGRSYYTTPLRVRAYSPAHRSLRPAGPVGRSLGIAGSVLMIGGTLAYVARKNLRVLSNVGSTKAWLEAHIFCGILGPALVTLHTSFRFNGIVSIAYWSMLGVVASGFVGRYLYVRIPRTLRGVEMDRRAIEERVSELRRELGEMTVPPRLLLRIEEMERGLLPTEGERHPVTSMVFGSVTIWRKTRAIEREIRSAGLNPQHLRDALHAEAERINLLRRAASLDLTRRLFALWHVFHKPFVWVLAAVFVLHVGVAIYFGYAAGGR